MGHAKKIEKIDEGFLRSGAATIKMSDVEKALGKSDEIKQKMKGGQLAQYLDDVKTFLSMIKDYVNGSYREVPWWTIAAITFSLLYVLSPIDLIPDFVPVIGLLDDAAVVALCILLVREEVETYRAVMAQA